MNFEFKGTNGRKTTGELIHKYCGNPVDFATNKNGEFVFFCPECREGSSNLEYFEFRVVSTEKPVPAPDPAP